MRISDEKSFRLKDFGNVVLEVYWIEGLIEVKTKKNLNLFCETIANNKDLINSILKKVDYSPTTQQTSILKEVETNLFKTRVILKFSSPFFNDDVVLKIIKLILKIDVEKDPNIIADVLLNNGKENYIYKMLSESKPDDYYSSIFGGY